MMCWYAIVVGVCMYSILRMERAGSWRNAPRLSAALSVGPELSYPTMDHLRQVVYIYPLDMGDRAIEFWLATNSTCGLFPKLVKHRQNGA